MTRSCFAFRLAIVALILACTVVRRADACRCLEPTSAAAAYRGAYAAVAGRVVAVTPRPDLEGVEVTLEVREAWKSDLPSIIRVSTGTDCAFPFASDGSYLLFLFRDSAGKYSTERCMGNRDLGRAQSFLAWLRKNGRAGKVTTPGKSCGRG
jgi:hypothetical protein